MKIGIPKEIKPQENRIACTPGAARMMINNNHTVYIEKNGGVGSGYPDEDYIKVGAQILPTADDVWAESDMIIKVKEPLPAEYPRMKPGQIIAFDGENGPQANILPPGFHFRFLLNVLYDVEEFPVVEIAEGMWCSITSTSRFLASTVKSVSASNLPDSAAIRPCTRPLPSKVIRLKLRVNTLMNARLFTSTSTKALVLR